MKYEEEYTNLSNGIRWGNQAMLLNTLNKNSDLDLTYKEGKLFIMAVEDNNVKLVKPLLDYFKDNQLANYKDDSVDYLLLKSKMRGILEIAIEDVSLSEDMKAIISPYIDLEGSERSSVNNDDIQEFDNHINLPIRKSHSMDDLKNNSNSKKSYSTHEHSDEEFWAIKKTPEDLEFMKFKNDLLGHKVVNLNEHEKEVAGHLDGSTDHHSD
jgi:hypothetical protein